MKYKKNRFKKAIKKQRKEIEVCPRCKMKGVDQKLVIKRKNYRFGKKQKPDVLKECKRCGYTE